MTRVVLAWLGIPAILVVILLLLLGGCRVPQERIPVPCTEDPNRADCRIGAN